MTSNYEKIRRAIEGRLQVIAQYDGHMRHLCPHVIGRNKKGGAQALFYQFGGGSSQGSIIPGSEDNWRCIPVDEMHIHEIKPGDWHTAANYSPQQTCVARIDVEI